MRPFVRCAILCAGLLACLCVDLLTAEHAQARAPGGAAGGAGAGTGGTGAGTGGTGSGTGGTGSGTGGTGAGTGGTGAGTGGAGGGTGATGGGSGGGPRPSPHEDPGDPTQTVETISRQAQSAVDACGYDEPRRCIADALDGYAAALRRIAPRLDPRLRGLPNIVAGAAARVRAARTNAEAIRAVKTAIAEVHKSITLLRADDPGSFGPATRAGVLVADTLQAADAALERATGL